MQHMLRILCPSLNKCPKVAASKLIIFTPNRRSSSFWTGLIEVMSSSPITRVCEQAVVFSHESLNLPWAAGLLGVTALARLCTLPLEIKSQQVTKKNAFLLASVQSKTGLIETAVRDKLKKGDTFKTEAQIRKEVKRKKSDFYRYLLNHQDSSIFQPGCFAFANIYIFLSVLFSWRNLCMNPIQMYETQHRVIETAVDFGNAGFLWIPAFSMPDPYVTPVLMAFVVLAQFQLRRAKIREVVAHHKSMYKNPLTFHYKLPLYVTAFLAPVAVGVCAIMPAGFSLPMVLWTTMTFCVHLAFELPKVQERLKLTPLPFDSMHPVKRFLSMYNYKSFLKPKKINEPKNIT